MRHIALALAATLLWPLSAEAQFGNPGGYAPDTEMEKPGIPAPDQTNHVDVLFARLIGEGGMAEVDLGQLAADKAQSPAIKEFGSRMAEDHSKANIRLKDVADAAGLALPTELNLEHKAMREKLRAAERPDFDVAYMSGQVQDHLKAAQLLAWEIDQGQDTRLQAFAAETLPVVLEHLRMAQDILVEARTAVAAR